jgi:hypothetical protein
LLWRKNPREGSTHLREHAPLSGVEEERLIPDHQELVEGEAGRRSDLGLVGREPIDAVGDLVDAVSMKRSSPSAVGTSPPAYGTTRPGGEGVSGGIGCAQAVRGLFSAAGNIGSVAQS